MNNRDDTLQTQFDRLTERVDSLMLLTGDHQREIEALQRQAFPTPPPAPAPDHYDYTDHGDGTSQVIWSPAPAHPWMQARGALAHVRPGTASEDLIAEARGADEAAKWEDPRPWRAVADAYDAAYEQVDDINNFHDNDAR